MMGQAIELLPQLWNGLWVTILIAAVGSLVAILCSLLAGLGRLSRDPLVRGTCLVYITTFRGTSALVQLFWFYFALPVLLGIRLDALLVGILVLGLNAGAYGAEIVRSSIESVPGGQLEAAIALNLSRWQTMRHVVLPQAIVTMLPPMGNLLIELLKGTALVSMITVTDLTRAALFVRDDTLQTFEIFTALLVAYFAMSLVITAVVRRAERYFSRGKLPVRTRRAKSEIERGDA